MSKEKSDFKTLYDRAKAPTVRLLTVNRAVITLVRIKYIAWLIACIGWTNRFL